MQPKMKKAARDPAIKRVAKALRLDEELNRLARCRQLLAADHAACDAALWSAYGTRPRSLSSVIDLVELLLRVEAIDAQVRRALRSILRGLRRLRG